MMALIQAELLKLRTTRTTWALLGSALLVVLGVLILVLALFDRGSSVDSEDLGALFALTSIADLLVLSFGIVGAAGEFRHGTITSALLVTPARWPVVAAKAIAYAIAGLAYAIGTVLLCLVVALPWLAIKDASFDLGGSGWLQPVTGRILYAMFTAALGVGIGTLFRNQAAGLVVALIYVLGVEPALTAVSDAIGTYGLNGASLAMFGSDETFGGDALPFGLGTLLYLGYAVLFCAAGSLLLLRRDVS
jgi:ABC-2 type transport system permease protein